jgi:hypothetical protein
MSMSDEDTGSRAAEGRGDPAGGAHHAAGPLLGYASGVHYPVAAGAGGEAYREGSTVICSNGTILPARCILCGDPGAGAPIRLTLTWDASFRLTHVSTLELRKQACVYAFLCVRHRRIWSRARSIGGVGVIAGVSVMLGGMSLGIWSESSDIPLYTPLGIELTIAGFAAVIVAMFFFTLRSQTLSCRRIQEGYLYLEGAGEAFLDGLPAVPRKET